MDERSRSPRPPPRGRRQPQPRPPPPLFAPAPTAAEQHALPISSLPHAWLRISTSVRRPSRGLYIDGLSMLLELALLGLLDVPPVVVSRGRRESGSLVDVGAQTGRSAPLDGALERLRSIGEPIDARQATARLAPYVAALSVPAIGGKETRDRLRDAIIGDGPTDIRTALLVWMLKQDLVLGDVAREAIFPGRTAVTRRALRRAGPDCYALADHEVAAAAHRVLFATFFIPRGTGG